MLKSTAEDIIASGDIKGKLYVDCSTVHPDTSKAVSERIIEAGGEFVSCKYSLNLTHASAAANTPLPKRPSLVQHRLQRPESSSSWRRVRLPRCRESSLTLRM